MANDERAERLTESGRIPNASDTDNEPEPDDSEHRGDFAEGTATTHTPPGALMGDFAAGQENPPRTGTVQPRGDFATGQEEEPVDPTAKRGDYAKGLGDESRKDDSGK